eukprot:6380347-Amphidinium_carterae.1
MNPFGPNRYGPSPSSRVDRHAVRISQSTRRLTEVRWTPPGLHLAWTVATLVQHQGRKDFGGIVGWPIVSRQGCSRNAAEQVFQTALVQVDTSAPCSASRLLARSS